MQQTERQEEQQLGVKPGTENVTIVENHSREQTVSVKQRRVGKTVATYAIVALIITTIVSALIMRRWEFLLALVIFVPFLFLISAPVWLASATKKAQDENARQRGQATPNPPKGPTDAPDPHGPEGRPPH